MFVMVNGPDIVGSVDTLYDPLQKFKPARVMFDVIA